MNKHAPPLVSVCIPTYNHERYITQCLQSALMQLEDFPLEVLVGDDASTDGTESILRRFAERHPDTVRYYRRAARRGPGANMEHLIREARGTYIAHLDGDDFWLPGKLAAQITFLEAHPDASAVYTNTFCILEGGLARGVFSDFQGQFVRAGDLVRNGNFLNHSSMVYRAKHRDSLVGRARPPLDFHLHLILARRGALGYLPAPLTVYRIASSSSILIHANETVRELYWEALCDTSPPLVTLSDLSAGMAEFMRSIFFRSIRLRSVHLITSWWPRILKNAPLGKTRLLAQAGWSIFRVGMREAFSSLCGSVAGHTMKIFYPK